jgi:hypothetical protein
MAFTNQDGEPASSMVALVRELSCREISAAAPQKSIKQQPASSWTVLMLML